MDYHEFVGEVQDRLELPGLGEAVRATRAVLTTLGERIPEGEASNLAGALPIEIDRYLLEADSGQRFDFDEFVDRVADRATLGDDEDARSEAVFYTQAIFALLADVAPGSEFEDVHNSFPATKTTRRSSSWSASRKRSRRTNNRVTRTRVGNYRRSADSASAASRAAARYSRARCGSSVASAC